MKITDTVHAVSKELRILNVCARISEKWQREPATVECTSKPKTDFGDYASRQNVRLGVVCRYFERRQTMDALEFLKERKRLPPSNIWSKEHPHKTRQSVFLEQYPEAELTCTVITVAQ